MHPSVRTNIPSGFGRREDMLPPEVVAKVRRFYTYQAASSFAIWIPFWALWTGTHMVLDKTLRHAYSDWLCSRMNCGR